MSLYLSITYMKRHSRSAIMCVLADASDCTLVCTVWWQYGQTKLWLSEPSDVMTTEINNKHGGCELMQCMCYTVSYFSVFCKKIRKELLFYWGCSKLVLLCLNSCNELNKQTNILIDFQLWEVKHFAEKKECLIYRQYRQN